MAKRTISTNTLLVKQASGSSENLIELRDSAGSLIYAVDSAGTQSGPGVGGGGLGAEFTIDDAYPSWAFETAPTLLINSQGTALALQIGTTDTTTTTTATKDINVFTGTHAENNATAATGGIYVQTGFNESVGSTGNSGILYLGTGSVRGGNSGSIWLDVGTSTTGTRGKIKMRDGTHGTIGHVWTQSAADGSGGWAAAAVTSSGAVQSKSANYTVLNTDSRMLGNSTGGIFTFTLPAGSSDKTFRFTKTSSDFNAISITANGIELIADAGTSAASTTINTVGEMVEVTWNGTGWDVTDRRIPSKWESYTPTGSLTTNTTWTGKKRREGDCLHFIARAAFSGTNIQGVAASVTIPNGLTGDAAKSNTVPNIGTALFSDASASGKYLGFAQFQDPDIWAYAIDSVAANVNIAKVGSPSANFPVAIASGDYWEWNIIIPITGWKG